MKRPRVLHLVVLAALIVVAVATVILLVVGRGGADPDRADPAAPAASAAAEHRPTSRGRAPRNPPLLPVSRSPAIASRYRFVRPPLVYFHAPRPGRGNTRLLVMVRVVPRLPQRGDPERSQLSSMYLDGAGNDSFGGLPRVGDQCYLDSFDLSSAASGGSGNPPPPVFIRPRAGQRVTLQIEYREKRGAPRRSFATGATLRRARGELDWSAFVRRGLEQQGCQRWP